MFTLAFLALAANAPAAEPMPAVVDGDFFSARVEPVLAARCFECHAHGQTIKGGLALDTRSGLARGGEGGPVVVPGKPELSRLITAVRHTEKGFQMPPNSKLSDGEVSVLVEWIAGGAPDPRPLLEETAPSVEGDRWDALFLERLQWWSLQPLAEEDPPPVRDGDWPRNDVDRFILASLEGAGLAPAAAAEPRALARRLSLALTGLPPSPEAVEAFAANPSDTAYGALVDSLLASPHFGERWARHWMDVVHYADTHGYEWDTPAKNAWMYRDYLIRAFNNDVPYRQLVLEQIAGDLIPPRLDGETGLNESIIGPMALRLGERRHGDNAQAEGVTQEAVANMVDTVSKGFLATTVACAQCHDHKLDAVAQRDYYSLAGVLMSSRWITRSAEGTDPNGPVIEELRGIKEAIREETAARWRDSRAWITARMLDALPEEGTTAPDAKEEALPFPESVPAIWSYLTAKVTEGETMAEAWGALAGEFQTLRSARREANGANLVPLADFSEEALPPGWEADGAGMKYGRVGHGALVVSEGEGGLIAHLLPAGRWSHVWSSQLAGAVRSPLFAQEPPPSIAVEYAGGDYAAQSLIVDNALHSERMAFINKPSPGWLTFTAGNLDALAGGPDTTPRLVYHEFATKSLNNYYPPRDGYGGLPQDVEGEPRSWFGVTRAFETAAGYTPADELGRFEAMFLHSPVPDTAEALAGQLASLVLSAVEHWRLDTCDGEDVRLLNEAIQAGWLPNSTEGEPALAALVAKYHETAARLRPERTVGSVADWNEGRDAPLAIRGSYTTLGEPVPRGTIRFLDDGGAVSLGDASGRLELARNIARADNPLTARVYVNRIWHHLFGAGLVRTVDDFGHLGETPSHPELLDWLALRFVEEGWSTKALIRMLVTSATWRGESNAAPESVRADPENRLWHHMPLRRLEAEAIRDAMLAASGRLDTALYGAPINPYRVAEDKTKRLYAGPLDGDGRRSIYQKMTLMEPPKFLATFNQPIPKLTVGRRDTTNVPNQALALLNDPFVVALAEHWSARMMGDGAATPEARVAALFSTAFARPPQPEETARFVAFARQCAELRGVDAAALLDCQPVWQDVAHAIFNVKEFIYVQ